MTKRRVAAIAAILVVLAGLGAWLYSRERSAPYLTQLLPEADAVCYLDFRPLRLAAGFGGKPTSSRAAEYAEFVRGTGFEFEQDLDEFALAVHHSNESAGETRYSEIFKGRVDAKRLGSYLQTLAASKEHHGGNDIYLIPYEGRIVRVAILAPDLVAVSNTTAPANLYAIIDKYRRIPLFREGPQVLRDYHHRIPAGSVLWAIVRIGSLSDETDFTFPLPGGFDLTLPSHTVVVASVAYAGEARLQAEAFTDDDDQAKRISDHLGTVLSVYRQVSKPTDRNLRQVFNSIRATHEDHRAIFTAVLPRELLTRIISDAPMTPATPPDPEAPAPSPTPAKGGAGKRSSPR